MRVEDVKVKVEDVKMEKVRLEDVKVNEVKSDERVPVWLWGGESGICLSERFECESGRYESCRNE